MNRETLVHHVKDEMASVPGRQERLLDVLRRGRRRRVNRSVGVSVFVLTAMFLFVMFPVPFDPNPAAIAGSYQVPDVVEISDLEVAVEARFPVLENPNVWVGYVHPGPEFDTSQLGPNLSFTPGSPNANEIGDRVLEAVYLGDLDGDPFYIYAVAPPSVIDRVAEIADGNLSGEILGTTYGCCSGGDMDHEEGLPGLSSFKSGNGPTITTAEWLGLRPDVAVVAYEVGGSFIGWQTPVGGAVSLRLDHQPGVDVSLIAYTADGTEIRRYGPWPMADFDNFPFEPRTG